MTSALERRYLQGVIWLNRKAKSAAVRLTHLTGMSKVPMHPKHLVPAGEERAWYLAHVQRGMRVLDVGSGNGVHTRRAAKQAAFVVGMEYLWRDVDLAHKLNASEGVANVALLMDNVEQGLAVVDKQFDLVIFLDVIEHLYQRVQVLQEIKRVLRDDGMLLISAPNRATGWKRRLEAAGLFSYTDPDHKIEYTWAELQLELRDGGFEVCGEPVPIVYDTPWAGLIDVVGGFSLTLYVRLLAWKVRMALKHPEETIGWRLVCRPIPKTARGAGRVSGR